MSDMVSSIVQWLNVNPELAGLATFFISATESIAIIGTIIPGSVMMTAVGALVGAGVIPFWSTLIWAILGAIVGDGISYWLGYYFKHRIYSVWPFKSYPQILRNGETYFRKHGGLSVFIGRFVGPVRALVPVVAGMFGMRPLTFTIANIASAIGWAPVYMLPGFLLGAASQELPSEVAGHLVLTFLLWLLFILLCLWILRKSFKLIHNKIDHFLKWSWGLLEKSGYLNILIQPFKHPDGKKNHARLRLAFYCLLVTVIFFYLALYILFQGPSGIFINKVAFYFFRSLRSPQCDNILLYVTFLGDKVVLLPVFITLFAWLAWKKKWRIAWHVLALGALIAICSEFFKAAVHAPRPVSVLSPDSGFAFPSGHSTFSFGFYIGVTLLLVHLCKIKCARLLKFFAGLMVISVAVSRLYFGVHWFTDIIGGWLLATSLLMLVTLSYNRKKSAVLKPTGIILTIILTLCLTFSFKVYHSYNKTKIAYTKLDWPTYSMSTQAWWEQQGAHLPLYRINRFGVKTKILNLQWAGNLNDIQDILLKNGWEEPSKSDWISMLYRLSSVESNAHLPLVSSLYLDRKPVLVLTKFINGDKQLLILRFWDSHIILNDSPNPLWVGMVEKAPGTYSWLFQKRRYPEASFAPDWVFIKPPKQYEMKTIFVKVHCRNHQNVNLPMIFLKPKVNRE